MATMSTYRQDLMETEAQFPISLADGIVLVQCLGLTRAVSMVSLVVGGSLVLPRRGYASNSGRQGLLAGRGGQGHACGQNFLQMDC